MLNFRILICAAFLTYSLSDGQIENLIGLPIDYDFSEQYQLDSHVNNDDIWNKVYSPKQQDDSPIEYLQSLCEQNDLELDNQLIECENLKIVPKNLRIDKHDIRKRDAEEEGLDGSGEDPPAETEPTVKQEEAPFNTQSLEVPLEVKLEAPKESAVTQPEAPTEPVTSEDKPENKSEAPEPRKHETEPKDHSAQDPTTEAVPVKAETSSVPEEKQVPTVAENHPDHTLASEQAPEGSATTVKSSETETPKKDESKSKKPATEKKLGEGEKVTLGKGQESEVKSGRREHIEQHQSGAAVLNFGGNMIETEKKIGGMKPHESLKTNTPSSEEPNIGQASEASGRKDNTILITLFVAVLAVGAAAFAYNFIKKRKNRANASRSEQNGAAATEDPEEGKEMKPLMTGEQKNTVEFTDEK